MLTFKETETSLYVSHNDENKSYGKVKKYSNGVWVVEMLSVSLKGKGIGNMLLSEIIKWANNKGVDLYLEAVSTGPMSDSELENWYSRNGFEAVDKNNLNKEIWKDVQFIPFSTLMIKNQ
jgi:N-acetylglutamate synthase-like GNAT family acetyltransferase